MFVPTCYSYCIPFLINQVSVMISFVSVVPKHGSFENWYQTFDVCCHCEILDANRSSDQTRMVAASWARRVEAASWKRPLRLALTEFKHINKYVFVRMWKKLTLASGSSTPPPRTRPKTDNLAAIYEPTVYEMWEPQRLTTLWASTACYRDTFTLPYMLSLN
jgi:hypothetical protein